MNERYKELFKKAGGKTSTRNLVSNPVKVVETHELWDDQIEKFAELIVQECVEVLRMVPYECDGPEFGDEVVYQEAVKKHFGVEE